MVLFFVSSSQNKNMGILTLITFLLCLMPSISFSQSLGNYNIFTHRKFFPKLKEHQIPKSFAVIFDAGSSGTRVHVYHFDLNLKLIRIVNTFDFSQKNKEPLHEFLNPHAAATSLNKFLKHAKGTIKSLTPGDVAKVLSRTPLILGGTAGLRLLEKNDRSKSDRILESVTQKFHTDSEMDVKSVRIITGQEEGAYMWASVNYLMGNIGKRYEHTTGIIELGGASVQMAYALSNRIQGRGLSNSPYIKKMKLGKEEYDLYVHSYLGYGSNEFRNKIFPPAGGNEPAPAPGGNEPAPAPAPAPDAQANQPCRLSADNENTYSNVVVPVDDANAKYQSCKEIVEAFLQPRAPVPPCPYGDDGCTIGDVWNGGMGRGQEQLFATGSFFYVPKNVGMIPQGVLNHEVQVKDFETKAKEVCRLTLAAAEAMHTGPTKFAKNICVDLTYQYVFLTQLLGLDPEKEITLGSEIKHQEGKVEAAWTLGTALETVSKLDNFENLMSFI